MPLDTRISTAAANAEANATGALLDNGYLRIYSSGNPEDADVAPTGLLAELRFGTPAFNPSVEGRITSLPLVPDLDTQGDADAASYCAFMADGITPVFNGTVGLEDSNLNLRTSTRVRPHGQLHVNSVSYSVPRSR